MSTHLVGVRCNCKCGRLLCIQLGALLHLKQGETWWVFDGRAQVICGRCRRATTFDRTSEAKGAAR